MQITASAVSLTVEDVPASSAFLTEHFGFRQEMGADGFTSLTRQDAGMHVAFLRRGLEVLQVTDPNGIIVQLMDWAARPGNQPPRATAPAALCGGSS